MDEAAEVKMGSDEVLTPYLGECNCVRVLLEAGEICTTCGGHVGVMESNGICEECELSTGDLLKCFACNVSFHRVCMPNVRWGLTGLHVILAITLTLSFLNPNLTSNHNTHLVGFGLPAPWCEACYDEWANFGCSPVDPLCLVNIPLTLLFNQNPPQQTLTLSSYPYI
jgi:hypothetical protein